MVCCKFIHFPKRRFSRPPSFGMDFGGICHNYGVRHMGNLLSICYCCLNFSAVLLQPMPVVPAVLEVLAFILGWWLGVPSLPSVCTRSVPDRMHLPAAESNV
jgi:hypothetical protein